MQLPALIGIFGVTVFGTLGCTTTSADSPGTPSGADRSSQDALQTVPSNAVAASGHPGRGALSQTVES